ncbi:hypothetical protein A3G63_02970 [Candidatus Kaiserbacteria bacterium RIFCSPLOWO2_12_FULL_52_8]|uniref:AB hydrolase-1 domain-containing protein n=1 Tax=Candidatus Kaiserbacteria bacterium RIFCSPHIGHO2_01_FULL_53_31 TaxID=1798481 RepID=A0A1F6CJE8_9BACT|nr:MAG: hypothetical protein A2678_01285 [Candidatus Kaiserbacteria bacterium RIFCSPHIGHO2_01_FULL_53_31]OGG94557.1 MAG: hypothetical protein A3G63_02970 [Candidatus Kaiserbacteria bacterium RIFCSPLOWO2_12_FULL_52_8]
MEVLQYFLGAVKDLGDVMQAMLSSSSPARKKQHNGKIVRVLFLPGFCAPQHTRLYVPLKTRLENLGCQIFDHPLTWHQYNFGDMQENVEILTTFCNRHEISLIVGHSYGGDVGYHTHFATGIPTVSLASPLVLIPLAAKAHAMLGIDMNKSWRMDVIAKCLKCKKDGGQTVPLLSVHSSTDRIVPRASTLALGARPVRRFANGHGTIVLNRTLASLILQFRRNVHRRKPCVICTA